MMDKTVQPHLLTLYPVSFILYSVSCILYYVNRRASNLFAVVLISSNPAPPGIIAPFLPFYSKYNLSMKADKRGLEPNKQISKERGPLLQYFPFVLFSIFTLANPPLFSVTFDNKNCLISENLNLFLFLHDSEGKLGTT
jgi:hypothetical protein